MKIEKNKLINCIIISFVFAFNICVFAPLEFYYSNIFDLWFTLDYILPTIICTSLITFITLFLISYFSKGKIQKVIVRIIFILMLGLYIQGNYLNIGYDVLDGSEIDWNSMIKKGVINTLIWVIIILIFSIVLIKEDRFKKVSNLGSLFVFGIQILTLVIIVCNSYAYSADTNLSFDKSFYLDSKDIFEVSEEENIIVFVSDTFEATYMNMVLNKYPEYKEKLKDFIYFDNATAASLMTYSSMPTLLTGEACKVGQNLKQNINYCFENSEFYDILHKNNYDVELYTDVNLIPADETRITNKIDKKLLIDSNSKLKLSRLLYECVLYKYMPHFLKSGFVVDTSEFNRVSATEVDQYGYDDVKFYKRLVNDGITSNNENKKYKLYHLSGVHTPYKINRNVEYYSQEEYNILKDEIKKENQILASLNIFIEYIENLKKTNTYDKSTIILLADHGWENRYHINFLIKKKDYENDFSISHAPIAMTEDFIPTILNIATNSKEYGKDIFDYSENENRQRNIYNYTFTRGDNTYNVLSKLSISTERSADDIDGYYISNSEYVNSDEIPTKQYEFGKEINISKNKNMKYVVLDGILGNNIRTISKGTNIGNEAQIRILTKETDSNVKASLTINKVYYNNQKIEIFLQGNKLYEYEFDKFEAGKIINFEIPKDIWNANKCLELDLKFPDGKLGNPSALGEETLFMSMCIEKIIFNK